MFGAVDVAPLRAARARLTVVDAELAALGGAARERAREIDLLRFQVAELDAAALDDPDEDQQLADREDVLADAAGHREAGAAVHDALADDGGVRDAMATALSTIAGRTPFGASADRLAALLAELDDVIGELRDTAEGIDEDPEQLEAVRRRRQLLRDLGRKYGDDVGEMMRYRDEAAGAPGRAGGPRPAGNGHRRRAGRGGRRGTGRGRHGRRGAPGGRSGPRGCRHGAAARAGAAARVHHRRAAGRTRPRIRPASTSSSTSPPTRGRRRCR